uniref:MaoC-like dehydratase n=1 Tax=Rhodospirillum rubrum (strain ATCC 11170 / ATH 1.1.1 / DSM 467 / LMG 4362 / NCIMB 8255 / S1) TaxID=269796 RepID=UPI000182A43E
MGLFLEDLAVGDRFDSARHRVEAAAIKAFAGEFDPQPFHLDEEAARHSLFGGLAASGWHTAAITMRLLVTSGLPLAQGIIGAGTELSWPNPTRPGDELHVETTVLAITPSKSRPDRAIVTCQSDTLNQRGEVVQRSTAKVVVFRRPLEHHHHHH